MPSSLSHNAAYERAVLGLFAAIETIAVPALEEAGAIEAAKSMDKICAASATLLDDAGVPANPALLDELLSVLGRHRKAH